MKNVELSPIIAAGYTRKVENRIGKWIGPCTVVTTDITSEIILVSMNINIALKHYNVAQVKPILLPEVVAISS